MADHLPSLFPEGSPKRENQEKEKRPADIERKEEGKKLYREINDQHREEDEENNHRPMPGFFGEKKLDNPQSEPQEKNPGNCHCLI